MGKSESEPASPACWHRSLGRNSRSSRPTVVVLALTLLATLVGITPAQASTSSTFTARALPSATVAQLAPATISARLTPGGYRTFRFQRFASGAWRTIYIGRTNSAGSTNLRVATTGIGATKYRYLGLGTARYRARYSNSVTITVKPGVTAGLSSTTVVRGGAASMNGKVFPIRSGRVVYLQRYYSKAWHTQRYTRSNLYGGYWFGLSTTSVGGYSYRAYMPRVSASLPGSTTGAKNLTVYRTMVGPFLYTIGGDTVTKREAEGGLTSTMLRSPYQLDDADITPAGKIVSVESTPTTSRIYVGGGGVARHAVATARSGRCYRNGFWAADNRHLTVYEGPADGCATGSADSVKYLDTVTMQMIPIGDWQEPGLDWGGHKYTGGPDGTLLDYNADISTATMINPTTSVRTTVNLRGLTNVINVEFTPLGDLLVTTEYPGEYFVLAKATPGSAPRKIASTRLLVSNLNVPTNGIQFSPDGKKIAWVDLDCTSCSGYSGPMATFVSNADGTGKTRIANFPYESVWFTHQLKVEWIGNSHLIRTDSDGALPSVIRVTGGSPTWTAVRAWNGLPRFIGWTH